MYRRLFILIEGSDDGRFFDRIVKPIFEEKYDSVNILEHAQKPPKVTRTFINNINAMSSDYLVADYVYVTDINNAPCITYRKQAKHRKLNILNKDRILVVVKEIESWYLAGLDEVCSRKCGVPFCPKTDDTTKEQFNRLIPKKFDSSRIVFLQEILKNFQVETAKQKNESFRYFLTDFLIKHGLG